MEKDDFVVAFYRNLREEWNKKGNSDNSSHDNATKALLRDYQDTTKTSQEMIKDIMRKNPTISAASIAKEIGLSVSGVQYHIKKMKASGEIERVGADYGGAVEDY